jgi:Bacterial RNA polymerase, alpha chain C terminal domain
MTAIANPAREFYTMPIDPETEPQDLRDLDLSARAYTALHKAGYTTIAALLTLTEEELLSIPGLQARGTDEVQAKLGPYRPHPAPVDEDSPPEGDVVSGEWQPVITRDVVSGLYEISPEAYVRRTDTGTVLKAYRAGHQFYIGLRHSRKPDQSKSVRLDRLVLETFRPTRSKAMKPLHADDDPANCRLDNLMWASPDHPKFKDQRTRNAKRAAATRAKSAAATSRGRLPAPTGRDRVSVQRTYGYGNISITVNDENLGSWPQGLSTPQDRADALVLLQQINEMDRVMGLI